MTRLPGRYDNRVPRACKPCIFHWMDEIICSSQKAKEDDPERETEKERKTERQKEKEREREPSAYD